MAEDESQAGTFIAEGHWAVEALLETGRFHVREVVIEQGRHQELRDQARDQGANVVEKSREEIRSDRGFVFHRGVYATVDRPVPTEPNEADWGGIRSMVIPWGLADPGNLGTVIRAGVGLGADAIAIPAGLGVDPYNRKCIRASATAIFRTSLFEFSYPPRFLAELKERGFVLFGSSLREESTELAAVRGAERMAILFGSEGEGLDPETEAECDETIRIPMASDLDSLNVGASAAIVLYELLQRRRRNPS